jgi:alpha-beta hydrolase superfamily lysophospholipase
LLQVLQSLLTNKGEKDPSNDDQKWQIYVTGHSLGGALASLCAFEIGRIKAGRL